MKHNITDNSYLAFSTVITTFGDFLTFFAVIYLFDTHGFAPEYAGLSVVARTIGVAVGAIISAPILRSYMTRDILFRSQIMAALISVILFIYALKGNIDPKVLLFCLATQAILKQIFDSAKELHSQSEGKDQQHVKLQSQLIIGFYTAQVTGPVLAYVLLKSLPLYIPLGLDTLSFLVAAVFSASLKNAYTSKTESTFKLRMSAFLSRRNLVLLTLLRSVGFWIGCSVFNFVVFSVTTKRFALDSIASAWIYSSLGVGAIVGSLLVRKLFEVPSVQLFRGGESAFAVFGHILFALSIVAFATVENFPLAVITFILGGFGMGINAVATQTMRRRLATAGTLPGVIAMESLMSRVVDGCVGVATAYVLFEKFASLQTVCAVAAAILGINGLLHLLVSTRDELSMTENRHST